MQHHDPQETMNFPSPHKPAAPLNQLKTRQNEQPKNTSGDRKENAGSLFAAAVVFVAIFLHLCIFQFDFTFKSLQL